MFDSKVLKTDTFHIHSLIDVGHIFYHFLISKTHLLCTNLQNGTLYIM